MKDPIKNSLSAPAPERLHRHAPARRAREADQKEACEAAAVEDRVREAVFRLEHEAPLDAGRGEREACPRDIGCGIQ